MVAILISICILANLSQNVFNKEYAKRESTSPIFFTLITSLSGLLFFLVISSFSLSFDGITLLCGSLCAIGLIVTSIFFFFAIRTGPLALSGLILTSSLALPTLYGMLFLNEPMGRFTVIGAIMLVVALILVNYEKSAEKIKFKWLLFSFLAFLGNGLYAVVQKIHQVNLNGDKSNELMVVTLGFAAVFLLFYVLVFDRKNIAPSLKVFWAPLGYGILNAANNLCLMLLAVKASASLVYPVISGGDMVALFFLSLIFYKERFSPRQWIGIVMGILSVILLSI